MKVASATADVSRTAVSVDEITMALHRWKWQIQVHFGNYRFNQNVAADAVNNPIKVAEPAMNAVLVVPVGEGIAALSADDIVKKAILS